MDDNNEGYNGAVDDQSRTIDNGQRKRLRLEDKDALSALEEEDEEAGEERYKKVDQ